MIDLSKTMMIVASYPEGRIAPELLLWAMKHKIPRIGWVSKRFVECTYNMGVKLALTTDSQHFIFADNDIRPTPETEAFLEPEAPLVACEYPVAREGAWQEPHEMHSGLFRCDRVVLERIRPPWFYRVLTHDGTKESQCVCEVFRRQAAAVGYAVVRSGKADHTIKPNIVTAKVWDLPVEDGGVHSS